MNMKLKIYLKVWYPSSWELLVSKEDDLNSINVDKEVVLKAQVLVGGRGKAGGILFASNKEEFIKKAEELFNKEVKGEKVEKILVEEKLPIEKEYYVSIIIDRDAKNR